MAKERDDPRGRKIADQLEGLMDDGEAFLMRCEGERIRVFEAEDDETVPVPSRLADREPALHGKLLRAEAALDAAGSWMTKLVWLVALLAIVGIATGWLGAWLGIDVEPLQSFWVYVAILGLTITVTSTLGGFFERIRYAGLRAEVHRAIDESGLDADTAISLLATGNDLTTVAKFLKRDDAKSARRW